LQTVFASNSKSAISPTPVTEQAPDKLSAYVPQPMLGESPILPGNFNGKPPVDVAVATLPALPARLLRRFLTEKRPDVL